MNITCEHCESEIDTAKDPRCVVYDPSGSTDVSCAECRQRGWERCLASQAPDLEINGVPIYFDRLLS